MTVTKDDFEKVWASSSPLTPYSFSESQYKEGWNFIGSTPPSRQMWDFLQKQNDEKMQYLLTHFDNYLPLSGGTLTGVVNGVTPTAGDNSTKIATTGFVNAKAGNYLPLSGGTMTGSILYVNNGKVFSIGKTEVGNVDLGWNWVNREGAGLGLRSTDHHSNPGEFILFARDANNACSLTGKPGGNLTWDDKEIERVSAKGTNGIRFESGIQICWGTKGIPAGTSGREVSGTMTFPFPFKNNDYVLTFGNEWCSSSSEYYRAEDKNAANFKFTAVGVGTNGHNAFYVAIGYWK